MKTIRKYRKLYIVNEFLIYFLRNPNSNSVILKDHSVAMKSNNKKLT